MCLSQESGTQVAEFIRHSQVFKQAILARKIDNAKQKSSAIRSITVIFNRKRADTRRIYLSNSLRGRRFQKSTRRQRNCERMFSKGAPSIVRPLASWVVRSRRLSGKLMERKRLLRRLLFGSNLFLKIVLYCILILLPRQFMSACDWNNTFAQS